MIRSARVAVAGATIALLGGLVAAPASAADAYNATIAGQRGFTPLVNLVQSSTLTVDVVNLPAGVGLYALHCKVPTDPRSAPTVCDQSTGAAAYLPATDAARATASLPIKVNAEFCGTNPNPTTGVATGESVDCRADTGNPGRPRARSTCSVPARRAPTRPTCASSRRCSSPSRPSGRTTPPPSRSPAMSSSAAPPRSWA